MFFFLIKFIKQISVDRTTKASKQTNKQTKNNNKDDKMVNDGQKMETITNN